MDRQNSASGHSNLICSEQILLSVLTRVGTQDARSLARACCTCRAFNEVGSDKSLWRKLCQLHFPNYPVESPDTALVEYVGGHKQLHSIPVLCEVQFSFSKTVAAVFDPPCLTAFLIERTDLPEGSTARMFAWGFIEEEHLKVPKADEHLISEWGLTRSAMWGDLLHFDQIRSTPPVFNLKGFQPPEDDYEITCSPQAWQDGIKDAQIPLKLTCTLNLKPGLRRDPNLSGRNISFCLFEPEQVELRLFPLHADGKGTFRQLGK